MVSTRFRWSLVAEVSSPSVQRSTRAELPDDRLDVGHGRERAVDEVARDLVVLATRQQDPVGVVHAPARSSDLLVVGDGGAGSLVVDDEAQVGLVEAHAQGDRGHQHLEVVGEQPELQRLALVLAQAGAVRLGVDAPLAQEGGDPLGVIDRQAVDDARPAKLGDVLREPRHPLGRVVDDMGAQAQ